MTDSQVHLRADEASAMQVIGDLLEVGVLCVDRSLMITGWNRWLESATGKLATQVIGQPLRMVDPNLRPPGLAALRQAINGAPVVLSHRLHGFLLDIPARRGTQRYLRMQQSARVIPIFGADGEASGAVALIQDVTERVGREEDLRDAMEAAQSANQAKSDFLAAMSHELRTPIGAISAYADLLGEGIFGSVTLLQQEHLSRIKSVASHLIGVVDEILTFARIEAGREQLHLSDVDALTLMRDAMLAVAPLMAKKGLKLQPQAPADAIPMRTDPVKVRQILINLLGNAVKFTERGFVSMALELMPGETAVRFRVADSGVGIAAEDLSRIFEPFVQVSNSYSRSHEGTGLGLSVSRILARMLGGDLTVESTVGVGSTFTAVIPR